MQLLIFDFHLESLQQLAFEQKITRFDGDICGGVVLFCTKGFKRTCTVVACSFGMRHSGPVEKKKTFLPSLKENPTSLLETLQLGHRKK